jgi:hypothetical protein
MLLWLEISAKACLQETSRPGVDNGAKITRIRLLAERRTTMTMRDMLNRANGGPPRPEDYAPKALRAVELAMQPQPKEPAPMPNSSDAVVKSFLDMGETIAASMEAMGERCAEQGEARKREWFNAAQVARKKAEIQAREAGEFIDDLGRLRAISEKLPQPPAAEPVEKPEETQS